MPVAGGDSLSINPGRPAILRLPEAAFVLIGAGAALTLLARLGWRAPESRETVMGTSIYVLTLLAAARWPTMADSRVRLGINYLCVAWLYGATSRVSHALGSPTWDATLLGVDRRLFGETPSVGWQACSTPWLTDGMSVCYAFYHVYLHGLLILAACTRSSSEARRFGDGLYTGFAVGFVGYLLVPALGPGAAFPTLYTRPLAGGAASALNAWIVEKGAAIYGNFPSLHVLVTALLLAYDWHWCRRRFWWVLGPATGLLASTLYLRYHYAVDLLAGFGMFAILRATSLHRRPPSP